MTYTTKMIETRRLQEINREAGNLNFVYFPPEFITYLKWKKGDELRVEFKEGQLIIKK
jgi:formylmethanofuran dehydrogenase subunit D